MEKLKIKLLVETVEENLEYNITEFCDTHEVVDVNVQPYYGGAYIAIIKYIERRGIDEMQI